MRVFVTGASGHIGSAVVEELTGAGHEVLGLARSDASAAVVSALGGEVRRGDFADTAALRDAAREADAAVHLAFDHATMTAGDFAGAAATDLGVVRTLGDALAGTGKALLGVGMTPTGDPATDAVIAANPRSAVSRALAAYTERDVRVVHVAIPPVTHSARDTTGFLPTLIGIARARGVSGYLGEGANRWPAAHVQDVARLYRLAVEKAPAGAQLHAATEPGVPVREIAERIALHLGIPARGVPAERAAAHFRGFPFIGLDLTMPNDSTRALLGWTPSHPGVLGDLDAGHYFTTA
ncbi:NAD-dependent epimerase/dehydratase family protein [Streptomyces sp. SPB78]|uniref:NAD-dependent epimerase/dehydratase family protein n=1 Tax=Streptomyces sp. (strain SPB78) TaxID=591157 RepID=UPI0001B58A47|nr:NAD-dependent epimerase/dehydratase family protein [Streptomyces sp. SPB78]